MPFWCFVELPAAVARLFLCSIARRTDSKFSVTKFSIQPALSFAVSFHIWTTTVYSIYTVSREPIRLSEIQYPVFGI